MNYLKVVTSQQKQVGGGGLNHFCQLSMVYGYRFQSLRAHLWSHDASKMTILHAKNREKLPHGIMERLHNPPLVAE